MPRYEICVALLRRRIERKRDTPLTRSARPLETELVPTCDVGKSNQKPVEVGEGNQEQHGGLDRVHVVRCR